MAEQFGFKTGFGGGSEFGKWIFGMFPRVAGERGKRFDLADGFEPSANLRAVLRAPGFDRHAELRRPEDYRTDGADDRILARVEHVCEAAQAPDAPRCGLAIDLNQTAEAREQWRTELVRFESLDDLREEIEIVRGFFDRCDGFENARAPGDGEQRFYQPDCKE